MNLQAPNINALWCELLMEELYRSGVTQIGVAPGSRSTPLALAAVAHPKLNVMVHFDERALAFHALGWGRATGHPAVVITTSGTAVANLAPAVAEASLDYIPLLLLTADRPPELRDTAANQTMDQTKFFGSFVRWQVDLPCPEATVPARMLLTTLDQAVARTKGTHPGPVHVNCMFREPLAPTVASYPRRRWLQPVQRWLKRAEPLTTYALAAAPAPDDSEYLTTFFSHARGVIVAGALDASESDQVLALARQVRWPILPDLQSGLRKGSGSDDVIAHADLILSDVRWSKAHVPEAVLLVGGRVTSKRLSALAQGEADVPVVRLTPRADRQDPGHRVARHIMGALSSIVNQLAAGGLGQRDGKWLDGWQRAQRKVAKTLPGMMKKTARLHEPRVAWELTRLLPEDHALFAGNSLPIRLLDAFAHSGGTRTAITANRGVSGIDGLLSTATGYAAGRKKPVTLLIGDLSLLHDLNALALLRGATIPVVAVVINNNGGGIFSFLPVAGTTRAFERVFGLPHGRTFAGAAAMFDLPYQQVKTVAALAAAYRKACQRGQSALIEISTDRATTLRSWRAIQRDIGRTLSGS